MAWQGINVTAAERRRHADQTCGQSLVPLPVPQRPRWWVPVRKGRAVPNSLAVYAPYSRTGRLFKASLELALRFPGLIRLAPAKTRDLPAALVAVLPALRDTLGHADLAFSLAVGRPGVYQKLTVQVMDATGMVLGFLKLPITMESRARVCHEAHILGTMVQHLGNSVPTVTSCGQATDFPALLLSPGPQTRGPISLTHAHADFLPRLHQIGQRQAPGEEMAAFVKQRLATVPALGQFPWRDGLYWAEERLCGEPVTIGWTHGDFAPWNTRMGSHGIFVFDWERADNSVPVVWDALHFVTQVSALLGRPWRPEKARDLYPETPQWAWEGLLALYLVDSSVGLMLEGSPRQGRALSFRRQALRELVR